VNGICGTLVIAFFTCHATDQSDIFHHRSRFVPAFGNLDSRHCGLYRLGFHSILVVRLWIEGFKLTWSALHPKHDDRHFAISEVVRRSRHQISPAHPSQAEAGG